MLDRLQNPPLNRELNQHLIDAKTANHQSILPIQSQEIFKENEALRELLGAKFLRPFSFNLESFYFLLTNLCHHYKVALALSSHNMLYCAYWELPLQYRENIFPLLPNFTSGKIGQDSINAALDWGADCFIVPVLNEDILTRNEIESLPQNVIKVVDISYYVRRSAACGTDIGNRFWRKTHRHRRVGCVAIDSKWLDDCQYIATRTVFGRLCRS